jgi:hypothetical protein
MSGEEKGFPAGPNRPYKPKDVYGGRWSPGEAREDESGRGSAPRPPGVPAPDEALEPASFTPDPDDADIAADDAGASARTEEPQPPAKKPA